MSDRQILRVQVTQTSAIDFKQASRNLDRRLRYATARLAEEWRKIVKSTTWFSSRPSPDSMIITNIRDGGKTLEFGWRHYGGRSDSGQKRLQLRVPIFERTVTRRLTGRQLKKPL